MDQIPRLNEMIRGIEIAMLTTVAKDGSLHSRPMATNEVDPDGTLWFFTRRDSAAAMESRAECRANASYSDPARSLYVTVSGNARLVNDRKKMQDLWDPRLAAWFPKGTDDPEMRLLRVSMERAEYWDFPSGALAVLASFARKVVRGDEQGPATHERIV
ncbi:MAG TPA: pyridoxamine 5'-phosphate oxidase family protein [Verrucomicrobiae bacterium]|jgi:general stress protein 26|nr:pyridoxamine 5'-phosphate oxidase family protein [Verrucomicrobiae bacterium]